MSKVEFKTGEVVEVSDYEDFCESISATFLANYTDIHNLNKRPTYNDRYPVIVIHNDGDICQFRYVRKPSIKHAINMVGGVVYETTEELYNEYLDVIKRIKESK